MIKHKTSSSLKEKPLEKDMTTPFPSKEPPADPEKNPWLVLTWSVSQDKVHALVFALENALPALSISYFPGESLENQSNNPKGCNDLATPQTSQDVDQKTLGPLENTTRADGDLPPGWSGEICEPLWHVEALYEATIAKDNGIYNLLSCLEDFFKNLPKWLHTSHLESFQNPIDDHVSCKKDSRNFSDILSAAPMSKGLQSYDSSQSAFWNPSWSLPKPSVSFVKDQDWLKASFDNLPPIYIGSFCIYGSHHNFSDLLPLTLEMGSHDLLSQEQTTSENHRQSHNPTTMGSSCLGIQINAATAFGSGYHETTQGCLLALEELSLKFGWKNGLDLGCGSGILAIAMKKLLEWKKDVKGSVIACDMDPESVKMTQENSTRNGVGFPLYLSKGFEHEEIRQKGPFDVIIANIFLRPILAMAQDFCLFTQPRGHLILSGFLNHDAQHVSKTFENLGFRLLNHQNISPWSVLWLQKKGSFKK
jgi:ribosomal protein L11 methyltransferase